MFQDLAPFAHLYALESSPLGFQLARDYRTGQLNGWLGHTHPLLYLAQFHVVGQSSDGAICPQSIHFPRFRLLEQTRPTAGRKAMLYLLCRQVLGKDTPNYPQQIGDPFSAGTMVTLADGKEKKIEDMQVGEVVLNHRRENARVTRLIKKNFSGRMITVHLDGWDRSLTATETHHGFIIPYPDRQEIRPDIYFGDMRVGDHLLTPLPQPQVRRIVKIDTEEVADHTVYCITTENEYTAIFNGVAQKNCVSFGGKNASEYLTCTQILQGTRQKWEPVFPPYYYHTSRMKAGGGQIPPNEDGSLGSWLAQSVQEWGTLFSNSQGVPPYSGQVAKQWGGTRDIGQAFYQFGKEHLVKSVAQIRSWDDLVAAIVNGYPCSTASNIGYSMEAGPDGFHAQTDEWGHQMAIIGISDISNDPYAIILNSWADCHGHLKDFDDGHDLPVGVLRVRRRDMEKHIRAGETYAWSQFNGMVEQDIDRLLWKVVGS